MLPDLVPVGESMKAAVFILEPEMVRRSTKLQMLDTVEGDIHDIGKTLAATRLSTSGFQAYKLGVDLVIETFVYKNNVFNVETIELSALLSTTTVKQQSIIEALEKFGLWPLMKVIF